MNVDDAQIFFDTRYPHGARVVLTDTFEFYVPRILVLAADADHLLVVLWDVLGENPPLRTWVEEPDDDTRTTSLRLGTDDDVTPRGMVEIYDTFPERYAAVREEVLRRPEWRSVAEVEDEVEADDADDAAAAERDSDTD